MLDLSNVTLLFVETRAHDITKRVIDDCLMKANFGDVLIYSDQPARIPVPGARYELVPDFPNKRLAGQFYYAAAMEKVETDFALLMEWDAGIIDPINWKPEFLGYDYIGAPWNTSDDMKVGNGGFTIMSKRFGHFLCRNRAAFPVCTDWDICRTRRPQINLRPENFTWAPYALAQDFSWELAPRSPVSFGWHGAFHWHATLDREELVTRAKLMTETKYLLDKMVDIFRYDNVEWLEAEMGTELWARYRKNHPLSMAAASARARAINTQNMRRQIYDLQRRKGQSA